MNSKIPTIRRTRLEPSAGEQAPEQAGRCLATTKAGAPCRGTATGDGFCPWHSPATNATLKRAWRRKGGLTRQRDALAQEVASVAPTLPPGVDLPPAPPESYDWGSALKIRRYLEALAIKVATGQVSVSVADSLRKLCETTKGVLDLELDEALSMKFAEGDE